ncbi:MAG: cell division protein ZapE [Proteobacteria bacterium]|nr:cell division protein ZapE [Pseudomonadota bacterium]
MHLPSALYARHIADGTLMADADQQAVLPVLDGLVERLSVPAARVPWRGIDIWQYAAGTAPQGVYMFGPVGRGKSMLMQLVFDSLPMAEKRRVHFHPFMEELHHRMHTTTPPAGVDMVWFIAAQIAAEARVLCFDEFYVTNIADAMLLGRLLEALFACGVTLCATSNWPTDNLFQDGHNRGHFMPFMAVLKKHMTELDLNEGADWRRAGGDAPATVSAAEAFARLGGKKEAETVLRLGHSDVLAKGMSGGVGWFTFTELCAKPLGRAEYMDLCAGLKGLVISDLYRLDGAAADAAMRFVVLVDIVYENHLPLRVTTDGIALEEVCTEGAAAFAFQRTLSRLHELQKMGG